MQKQTMSVPEMAQVLGIGVNKAYELARRPDFPASLRIGEKRIVISVEALQEWLKREAGKPIV